MLDAVGHRVSHEVRQRTTKNPAQAEGYECLASDQRQLDAFLLAPGPQRNGVEQLLRALAERTCSEPRHRARQRRVIRTVPAGQRTGLLEQRLLHRDRVEHGGADGRYMDEVLFGLREQGDRAYHGRAHGGPKRLVIAVVTRPEGTQGRELLSMLTHSASSVVS
jgi:hypothetical protein